MQTSQLTHGRSVIVHPAPVGVADGTVGWIVSGPLTGNTDTGPTFKVRLFNNKEIEVAAGNLAPEATSDASETLIRTRRSLRRVASIALKHGTREAFAAYEEAMGLYREAFTDHEMKAIVNAANARIEYAPEKSWLRGHGPFSDFAEVVNSFGNSLLGEVFGSAA